MVFQRNCKSIYNRAESQPRCYVSGWGQDVETGKVVTKLKKVDVPLMDSETCTERLRGALAEKAGLPINNPNVQRLKIHE